MVKTIKFYYKAGVYNDEQLKTFLKVGYISESQYKEIIDN